MLRLVQIGNGSSRRIAVVEEPHLQCLAGFKSIYTMTAASLRNGKQLSESVAELATGELLSYDDVYTGRSQWKLLPPIDVPGAPERTLVTGTGLTHVGSAKDRQAMHTKIAGDIADSTEPITDSMRMFQWGITGGRPGDGEIGTAPEWFYKGNGSVLQPAFAPLVVPAHGEDGGEEAEVAGIYFIGEDGTPYRLGMCAGNEFSDHKYERRNYLYLAGSKLRQCSIGPELVVDGEFGAVTGEVGIERDGETIWHKAIATGEESMSHSLGNLEHHHFKFAEHRTPGHIHVHFFGAHSLSFGEGIELREGDWMQVRFDGYGRALRNPIRFEKKNLNRPIPVVAMA
jgi:hypothetical protein